MHIDRSNYEIWFIDWLDGNLNNHQVEQLELFIDQNPDLREEFNDLAPVNPAPSGISFQHKEHLKKSLSDISESQLEYLCVAYHENDLPESQHAELLEIVNRYPEKKKTFDLIHKTILSRERVNYKNRSLLLKQTAFQKAIRLSFIVLSTAAAISLIIVVSSVIHGTITLKPDSSANNSLSDSTLQSPSSVKVADIILTDKLPVPAEKEIEYRSVSPIKNDNATAVYNRNIIAPPDDSLLRKTENQKMTINKVPVYRNVDMVKGIASDKIIASNTRFIIPDAEDERNKIGKFISKTIREKLLKEKTPPDSPLKGYEIAEAGVTGLNKLLGWQMVLDMRNDENGKPRSVYFSSQILKLNAPVKKKELQP
jgi:hypothetical protein